MCVAPAWCQTSTSCSPGGKPWTARRGGTAMEARSSATPTTWSTPWSPRWTRLRRCARCSRPVKIKASQISELWSSPTLCAFVFICRKIELWTARRNQRWRSSCCCRRSSCTWRSKSSVLAYSWRLTCWDQRQKKAGPSPPWLHWRLLSFVPQAGLEGDVHRQRRDVGH